MNKLVEIFCDVDDFCRVFIPQWEKQLIADGNIKRKRSCRMTMSEIMTVLIAFHTSNHRDFKNYYKGYIAKFYRSHFPNLLSYTRFLEVMPKAIVPLSSYFSILKGEIVDAKLTTGNVHDTKGVDLITTVRSNMKAKAMSLWDRAMLSRRFIIETINDQLKNISQIQHSRHRSPNGFMLNLLAGLVAYCLKENKPTLNINDVEMNVMVSA